MKKLKNTEKQIKPIELLTGKFNPDTYSEMKKISFFTTCNSEKMSLRNFCSIFFERNRSKQAQSLYNALYIENNAIKNKKSFN